MHLIYGILEQPVHSLQAINISALHGGLQRVQLLKPNVSIPELPSDMKTMEITAPDVVIPSQETTYWCYMAELPAGFPKHHIIMVRGRRRGQISSCAHILQIPCHGEAFRPRQLSKKHLPGPPQQAVASSCLLECLSRSGREVSSHLAHPAGSRASSELTPCGRDGPTAGFWHTESHEEHTNMRNKGAGLVRAGQSEPGWEPAPKR